MNKRYEDLMDASNRVRNYDNKMAIMQIVWEAADNASDTVNIEKAAPAEDWDRLFVGTIGVLLASGEYNKQVIQFFAKRGVEC